MTTERLTQEQLEAIRKRADDNGKWVKLDYMRYHEESPEFKKHAREDVKALLAEVERLKGIINAFPAMIRHMLDDEDDERVRGYVKEVLRNDNE